MRNQEEYTDYFDGPDTPDEPKAAAKEPKNPALKPEDPRYWDEPEPEFEHLRPSRKIKIRWWLAGAAFLILLVASLYFFVFRAYAENSMQYGYVEDIDVRGYIFKTYEGSILPYKNLMDTTRTYDGDFRFSVLDEKVAVKLRQMQNAHKPVKVVYTTYPVAFPWHGDRRYVVVAADTVNPAMILPPDRTPSFQ